MTTQFRIVDRSPGQFDFRLLVEESLAGIYVIQEDRFLYVNPMMAKLFGYSTDELIHERSVEDLVDPEDRERVRSNLRQRYEGEAEVLQYSFHARRRDGSVFDVEVRGRRVEIAGEPAVVGTLLDITDRREELERLRFLSRAAELLDSSLDYELTLDSLARLMIPSFADLCMIEIGYDGTLRRVFAGREAEGGQALETESLADPGVDRSVRTLLGSRDGLLFDRVPSDWVKSADSPLPRPLRGDGDPLRSLIVVPLNARGQRIGAMLLGTAESGRTYRQNDLEFAREVARAAALAVDNAHLFEEAQRAIERREEVLAVVSHDLRNPLNVILMVTGMALETERRRQAPLERVHRAALQMERLIRDLLDLAAIDAGGFSVILENVRVGSIARRTIDLHQEAAASRSITIETHIEDPDLRVQADEDRLVQALSNLVGNAIKFSPDGGVVALCTERQDGFLDFAVADSGPGIPEEELEAVFERFWRGRPGGIDGAGLGLSIVRGIAEAHRGEVHVDSRPGKGATFHIRIPIG